MTSPIHGYYREQGHSPLLKNHGEKENLTGNDPQHITQINQKTATGQDKKFRLAR
jgi:hypothetical protein